MAEECSYGEQAIHRERHRHTLCGAFATLPVDMAETDVSDAIARAYAEKERGNASLERGRAFGFQLPAGRDALKIAGKHYYEVRLA